MAVVFRVLLQTFHSASNKLLRRPAWVARILASSQSFGDFSAVRVQILLLKLINNSSSLNKVNLTVFGYLILISTDFYDFISPFSQGCPCNFFFRLRRHIKHKILCLNTFPISKLVKKTPLCVIFSTFWCCKCGKTRSFWFHVNQFTATFADPRSWLFVKNCDFSRPRKQVLKI